MWDENVDETPPEPDPAIDINALDDGLCKASSWRTPLPQKPTYENHFGPGGFNRCVGSADHLNRLHKDGWGNVFEVAGTGFRVIRREGRSVDVEPEEPTTPGNPADPGTPKNPKGGRL
jgi:hypothetical protein